MGFWTKLINDPSTHIVDGQISGGWYTACWEGFENNWGFKPVKACSWFTVNGWEASLGCFAEGFYWPMVCSLPFDRVWTEFLFGKIEGLLSEGKSLLPESRVFEFIDTVINMGPIMCKAELVGSLQRRFIEKIGYSSDHFILILIGWINVKNIK